MRKFKDFFEIKDFNYALEFPSASLEHGGRVLSVRFDSKDKVVKAAYTGEIDPWLSSLCFLMEGKTLEELGQFQLKNWESAFRNDQTFWDFYQDEQDKFFHPSLEILKALLEVFRGRDFLYKVPVP